MIAILIVKRIVFNTSTCVRATSSRVVRRFFDTRGCKTGNLFYLCVENFYRRYCFLIRLHAYWIVDLLSNKYIV